MSLVSELFLFLGCLSLVLLGSSGWIIGVGVNSVLSGCLNPVDKICNSSAEAAVSLAKVC